MSCCADATSFLASCKHSSLAVFSCTELFCIDLWGSSYAIISITAVSARAYRICLALKRDEAPNFTKHARDLCLG